MGSKPRFISGSRAAAVLGISEFQTRREVWQLIKEDRFPGWNAAHRMTLPLFEGNAATRWGLAFEDAVCELAEKTTNYELPDDGVTKEIVCRERLYSVSLEHPQTMAGAADQITCHVDGIYNLRVAGEHRGPGKTPTLHQGKTTNARSFSEKWGEPGTDRIPASYQAQVQHEMLCTGASREIVSVLVFPVAPDEWEKMGWVPIFGEIDRLWRVFNEKDTRIVMAEEWAEWIVKLHDGFHQYPVEADPSAQAVMLDTYREFWDRYIEGDEEPPLETSDDVRRAFPEPVGTIVVDETVEMWIAERDAITSEIGDGGTLAHRKEELTVKILGRVLKDKAVIDEESTEKVILRNAAGKKLASYSTGTLYANRGKSLYINDLSDDELRSVKKYLKTIRKT